MNSSAFGRLVWKEFHAQISLWVSLVLGALLLQTLLVATSGGIRDASTAFNAVGAIAFVLSACFVVASLGMLFAGESEEGTRDWLQQLPVRPWTLVTAKLFFAIVSSALFFATTVATGLFVAAVSGHSIADLLEADVSDYQKSLAGAFVWGLLFSLLFRRVMFVLLAAVFAEILTVLVINIAFDHRVSGYVSPEAADRGRTVVYLVVIACLLILDLVLARRWARSGNAAVLTAPRRLRSLTVPGTARRAETWLRLVAWASRRGSPDARETAVLVWREARAAVPFFGLWLLLGLMTTDLGPLIYGQGQILYQSPFQPLYLIATPAICGLMTCLGDQRQQMFRFLGERGVSPVRVWRVKQCVWLAVAVILCLLFLRWDSDAADRLRNGAQTSVSVVMTLIRALHVPTIQPDRAFDRPEDTALQMRFLWALGFSLFAAGQCASFWIRRPILAFGVLLVAAPVLFWWHYLLVVEDVPFWIGSWPLTFVLMAATLISASAWLRGRDSWKLRFTRLAAVALPVCAVSAAAAAHRAFSVPAPVFPTEVAMEIESREMRIERPDAEWSTRWRTVLRNFPLATYPVPSRTSLGSAPPGTREQLLALSDQLASDAHGQLDPLVLSPDHPVSVESLTEVLTDPFMLDPVQNHFTWRPIAEQWRGYEAALRITRYLAEESQSTLQWEDCIRARGVLLASIRKWAQRPDQTPESLQNAFEFLSKDYVAAILIRPMTINRQVLYDDLLSHQGRKWAEIQAERDSGQTAIDDSLMCAVFPGFERERMRRLLGLTTLELLSGGNSLRSTFDQRGESLRRWAASTPALPVSPATELDPTNVSGRFVPQSTEGIYRRARNQQAVTALIVGLQRFHLEHGNFPPSLSEFQPILRFDLYTNAPFGYEPQGLSAELYLPDGRVIPAGQPLLWTPGHSLRRFSLTQEPIAAIHDDALPIPAGVFWFSVLHPGTQRLHKLPLEPGKIMFLDLSSLETDFEPAPPAPPATEPVENDAIGPAMSGAGATATGEL